MKALFHKLRYPRRCYAVCAIARSGSNLLTDGLHATRRAGRPKQFFCDLFQGEYAAKHQLNLRDYASYVRGIIPATATSNEVFGFKVMGWYLQQFITRLRDTGAFGSGRDLDILREAFPRLQLIYIQRQDKLRQAISKARAYQSGLWKIQDGEVPVRTATFDPELIERCVDEVRREEEVWVQFFRRTEAEPFCVTYEELCEHYQETLRSVLEFLKIRISPRTAIGRPSTVRQFDATSVEWERRYRDLAHANVMVERNV